jgi:deoxyadenosine/deoxycytidine kinase
MPCLIILRGQLGAGKTRIGGYLRDKLRDSTSLDLDRNAYSEVEGLDEALEKENIVAELHDGGSHTSNPEEWIDKFKERNYNILSVILESSFETCLYRVLHRPDNRYTETKVRQYYDNFHNYLKGTFAPRAMVSEVSISTENKSVQEVGDEILKSLPFECARS